MKTRSLKWYGWQPDLPDARDYKSARSTRAALPKAVDLRPKCPPVYDQGQLGSCTANAIAGLLEFDRPGTPSRLFIYYGERQIEGTIKTDSGAQIRDGIKVVANLGACPETVWPYVIKKFATKPPAKAFAEAKLHEAITYARVPQTVSGLKACLANGFPVAFGFTVYESFESDEVAQSGVLNLPAHNEQALGGHAVVAVGYTGDRIVVRNSWGSDWGQAGYFTMPFAYVTDSDLASDFWQIESAK